MALSVGRTDMAEHREHVLGQLSARFAGRLSAEAVKSEFERAEADLQGQVRPDAAAELLYRLVFHRLDARLSANRAPVDESQGEPRAMRAVGR